MRVWVDRWQGSDAMFDSSDALWDHITTAHTSKIGEGRRERIGGGGSSETNEALKVDRCE